MPLGDGFEIAVSQGCALIYPRVILLSGSVSRILEIRSRA